MGGYGTCWIGSLEPDRTAAAGILASGHIGGGVRTANLLHLPVTVHIGTPRKFRDELKEHRTSFPQDYACHYVEYPATGHRLALDARTESFEWLTRHEREPLPRTVVWEPFTPRGERTHVRQLYWLRMEDPRGGTRIQAELLGENRIRETTRNVESFSLLLNADLVDTERPVVVELNGRPAYRGIAPPSLSAIVTSLDAKEDPALTFTRRVDLHP